MKLSENVALPAQEKQLNEELSLYDIVVFLRKNYRILLGGALLGIVLGLCAALLLPTEWEATALIRVGQSGNADKTLNSIQPVLVEPALQVVDRIKNISFQKEVMKKIGLSQNEDDDKNKLFRNSLKAKLEKSDLISINIRGLSADSAKLHLDTVVNQLKSIHSKMLAPTINRWRQEFAAIELELKVTNADLQRLTKSLDGSSKSLNPSSFAQAALLSNIIIARGGELRGFRERKLILEEMLSPERTFVTAVIGQIEVSNKAVYPKKSFFAIAGLIIGLFLGVVLSIFGSIGHSRHNQ